MSSCTWSADNVDSPLATRTAMLRAELRSPFFDWKISLRSILRAAVVLVLPPRYGNIRVAWITSCIAWWQQPYKTKHIQHALLTTASVQQIVYRLMMWLTINMYSKPTRIIIIIIIIINDSIYPAVSKAWRTVNKISVVGRTIVQTDESLSAAWKWPVTVQKRCRRTDRSTRAVQQRSAKGAVANRS